MNAAVLEYRPTLPSLSLPDAKGDWPFVAAMVCSFIVHGIALGWLPALTASWPELPRPLEVRIAVPPARMDTLAVRPAPTLEPAARTNRRDAGAPLSDALPVLAAPADPALQNAASVHSALPPVAAVAEPARPGPMAAASRVPAADAGALAAYGRELATSVAMRQRYPRVALLRQWQGTAVLQLELAADGRLLAVRVSSSSGHETLDRQALEMVREAAPLPPFPVTLAGRPLTVDVPVVFRINP